MAEVIRLGGGRNSRMLAFRAVFRMRSLGKSDEAVKRTADALFGRLRRTMEWLEILDAAGLSDARLVAELDKRLRATKVQGHPYRGTVHERIHADNAIRMAATALLAKLLGRDVLKVDAKVSAVHGVLVVPAEMSLEQWQRMVDGGPPWVPQGDGDGGASA